jgi:hypothetical protein
VSITVLTIRKTSQRDGCGHVPMVTVAGPLSGLAAAIAPGKAFGAS